MKELSIEEKAKAYDEALKVLRKYDGANIILSQSLKEEMFPELKENRDEKIKKIINRLIRYYHDVNFPTPEGFSRKDLLDWVEKQGEQKPVEWVGELEEKLSNATPEQLAEWKEKYFKEKPAEWSEEDERIRQDIENLIHFALEDGSAVSPAAHTTKEEAINWIQFLKDRIQLKQEWSEEDEDILNTIINHFKVDIGCTDEDDMVRWLKSLKDRVQPRQEWTKEDKERYKNCLQRLSTGNPEQPETINSKWFKEHVYSKPQSTWRPSDRQIEILKDFLFHIPIEVPEKVVLVSLYHDLLKLKE